MVWVVWCVVTCVRTVTKRCVSVTLNTTNTTFPPRIKNRIAAVCESVRAPSKRLHLDAR